MDEREHSEQCLSNSEKVKNYTKRFSRGPWKFLGPGEEKKWYGTFSWSLEGQWDSTAKLMVERFKETNLPALKRISVSSRGILEKKSK